MMFMAPISQITEGIAVCRWLKQEDKHKNLEHLPELAPPPAMIKEFLALRKAGNWDEHHFLSSFVPRYIKYLANSKEARKALNRLYARYKAGEDLMLACYCGPSHLCHRIVVHDLIAAAFGERYGDFSGCASVNATAWLREFKVARDSAA